MNKTEAIDAALRLVDLEIKSIHRNTLRAKDMFKDMSMAQMNARYLHSKLTPKQILSEYASELRKARDVRNHLELIRKGV